MINDTEIQIELEERTRINADRLRQSLPPDVQFILITTREGDEQGVGFLAYVSSIQRESAIELMKEFIHKWGADQ